MPVPNIALQLGAVAPADGLERPGRRIEPIHQGMNESIASIIRKLQRFVIAQALRRTLKSFVSVDDGPGLKPVIQLRRINYWTKLQNNILKLKSSLRDIMRRSPAIAIWRRSRRC